MTRRCAFLPNNEELLLWPGFMNLISVLTPTVLLREMLRTNLFGGAIGWIWLIPLSCWR